MLELPQYDKNAKGLKGKSGNQVWRYGQLQKSDGEHKNGNSRKNTVLEVKD